MPARHSLSRSLVATNDRDICILIDAYQRPPIAASIDASASALNTGTNSDASSMCAVCCAPAKFGVTPDFVQSMRDAGLTKVAARDLVKLRDHGISASYVKRAREIFKETPTVDQIIRLRTRGDIGGN